MQYTCSTIVFNHNIESQYSKTIWLINNLKDLEGCNYGMLLQYIPLRSLKLSISGPMYWYVGFLSRISVMRILRIKFKVAKMLAMSYSLRIFAEIEHSSYIYLYTLYLLSWIIFSLYVRCYHLFSQNPATNTENSAQSRSEHIFMELTLFVYSINSQYFCIKSGLKYLRYKRYNRNETEGHIFFCN